MLLSSLFDLHFKTPVRLMMGLYLIILFVIWTIPIMYLFFPPNVYTTAVAFGIPFFLANLMSKPIWGGKSFFAWLKTQIRFIFNAKIYYDCNASKPLQEYRIDNEYSVSRAKEFYQLFLLERRTLQDDR